MKNGLGQTTWIKWLVLQTFQTLFYYIVISLFYNVKKCYVRVSGSVLSLLYCLVFVSTPVCKNGAGHQVYICSLFCLVGRVKSGRYVHLCGPLCLRLIFV